MPRPQSAGAMLAEALARDFGSVRALARRVRRDGQRAGGRLRLGAARLPAARSDGSINQYAAEHSQAVAGGIPILALDMYEHAYHIDFGANAKAYVDTFMRNIDWKAVSGPLRGRGQGRSRRGRWCRRNSATCPASASRR